MGIYPTVEAVVTDRGPGKADSAKLDAMFPTNAYENVQDLVDTANAKFHPNVQEGLYNWSVPKDKPEAMINLDFQDDNALDQQATGSPEVPANAYAPFPNPENYEVPPHQPTGTDGDTGSLVITAGLRKPKDEGKKVFRKIGDTLKMGVEVHDVT